MLEKINKKKLITKVVVIILLALILFILWFFNRKFEVTFNDGDLAMVFYVRYNNVISTEDVEDLQKQRGTFIGWYEIIEIKDNEEVLAEDPFDFNTKIKSNIDLKAVYE